MEANSKPTERTTADAGVWPALTVWIAGFPGVLGAGLRDVVARDDRLQVVDPDRILDPHTVIARYRPRAVLLKDACLSSVMELRRLVVAHPATGVVVGVVTLNRERDQTLLAAGARMVVPLSMGEAELRAALLLVAQGLVGPPRVTASPAPDGLEHLTEREREVFDLLLRRRTAREIAQSLHIAVPTVHTHTRRIYEKLSVHSRAELEARAAQLSAGDSAPDLSGPRLSRDRVPYGQRSSRSRNVARPSALDMRAAMGIARWPRVAN